MIREYLSALGDIGAIIGIPWLIWEHHKLSRENRRLRALVARQKDRQTAD